MLSSTNLSPIAVRHCGRYATKGSAEVVRRAVSTPGAVLASARRPQRRKCKRCIAQTISPFQRDLDAMDELLPHNHQMWAIIGLYTGREDNIFWRRVPEATPVEAAGSASVARKRC